MGVRIPSGVLTGQASFGSASRGGPRRDSVRCGSQRLNWGCSSVELERQTTDLEVVGSNPTIPTMWYHLCTDDNGVWEDCTDLSKIVSRPDVKERFDYYDGYCFAIVQAPILERAIDRAKELEEQFYRDSA